MTQNNGVVQTSQNVTRIENPVERFGREVLEFKKFIKRATQTSGGERPIFPDFRLTDEIRHELDNAITCLESNYDLSGAFKNLSDVRTHFNNQLAGYAKKRLLSELRQDLDEMVHQRYDEDILVDAKEHIGRYATLTGQKFFEIEEASRLFWKANDALDAAEAEFEKRQRTTATEMAKKLREEISHI